MELNFTQIDNKDWVAEFEVKADFNIHLERDTDGRFDIYQKTAGDKYEYVNEIGWLARRLVYDTDFTSLVYPKQIKIVSSVKPTLAVVTMASSNSEGGDNADSNGIIEYHFEIPMVDAEAMGMKYQEGQIEGDFSDLVEKLYKYAIRNGVDADGYYNVLSWPEEDINITVNGDSANHELCAWYDENGNVTSIDILTNGAVWVEEARLIILPTKAVYSEGKEETPSEPAVPKNFIKFAPYSTDVYPESFTPQPISIDAVDDGGIIVFDDNVTEITVIEEAFSGAIPSSIEFCENVRYISSTAFDNCGYTEIKFHSIVPPEFTDGLGHIAASRLLNGIIYYPAGSDYSSLRSVTVDFGNKLLFENFEFVEFTPSPSPKPEQP